MDNFQLNNTSVYLGGQCKWDIVVKKENGKLVVDGFQLTPVSDAVPFNKNKNIQFLNEYHQDSIKYLYNDIKENFWDVTPSLNIYKSNDESVIVSHDHSYVAGVKRLKTYQLYKKQYSLFQPCWLEYIPEDAYLRFNIYVTDESGTQKFGGNILDLNLKKDNSFHDRFVNYFTNWLTYLNIMPNPDRYHSDNYENLGNDRVMYVDLKNKEAFINGVSVISGQQINNIVCNHATYNLLINERPNIDSDSILTTLFKLNNMVTAQLFNFNICFNLEDILSNYILRKLVGKKVNVYCDVGVIYKNKMTNLGRRTLFTNYEYIPREQFNPFVFINKYSESTATSYHSGVDIDITNQYSANVLDYLKDYLNINFKNKNKIPQFINHWGYLSHTNTTFNLYDGYRYLYNVFDDDIICIDNPTDRTITYKGTIKEISGTNGIAIPILYKSYNNTGGELTWLAPGHILRIGDDIGINVPGRDIDIKNIINSLYETGPQGFINKNRITENKSKQMWLNESIQSNSYDIGLTCIYVKTNNLSGVMPENYTKLFESNNVYISIDDNNYVLFTNDFDVLILDKMIDVVQQSGISDLYTLLSNIKEYITKGNEGIFYRFYKEIGIGYDGEGNEVYYKTDTHLNNIYRTDGKLSPSMIEDDNKDVNFEYVLDIKTDNIINLDTVYNQLNIPEISTIKDNWILNLFSSIEFVVEKSIDDPTPLKTYIREYINGIYSCNNDQILIDYIYKLYSSSFDSEYIYDDETLNHKMNYKIKLTLR
jgi:hypothetical protein